MYLSPKEAGGGRSPTFNPMLKKPKSSIADGAGQSGTEANRRQASTRKKEALNNNNSTGLKSDRAISRGGENDPFNFCHSDMTSAPVVLYDDSFESPYLVIMEPSIPNRNLGNYDPIAIGKLVARLIKGQRRIQINGRNQVKISCDSRDDANVLITSEILAREGYRTMIPES